MRVVFASIICLVTASAYAEPPPGTDLNSPLHQWYESLTQPDNGVGCCSMADCRPVQAVNQDNTGYTIKYNDEWMKVPPEKVIRGVPNLAGEPIACVIYYSGKPIVLCFEPGSAT